MSNSDYNHRLRRITECTEISSEDEKNEETLENICEIPELLLAARRGGRRDGGGLFRGGPGL